MQNVTRCPQFVTSVTQCKLTGTVLTFKKLKIYLIKIQGNQVSSCQYVYYMMSSRTQFSLKWTKTYKLFCMASYISMVNAIIIIVKICAETADLSLSGSLTILYFLNQNQSKTSINSSTDAGAVSEICIFWAIYQYHHIFLKHYKKWPGYHEMLTGSRLLFTALQESDSVFGFWVTGRAKGKASSV